MVNRSQTFYGNKGVNRKKRWKRKNHVTNKKGQKSKKQKNFHMNGENTTMRIDPPPKQTNHKKRRERETGKSVPFPFGQMK